MRRDRGRLLEDEISKMKIDRHAERISRSKRTSTDAADTNSVGVQPGTAVADLEKTRALSRRDEHVARNLISVFENDELKPPPDPWLSKPRCALAHDRVTIRGGGKEHHAVGSAGVPFNNKKKLIKDSHQSAEARFDAYFIGIEKERVNPLWEMS